MELPIELFPFSLVLQLDESNVETDAQRLARLERASVDLVGRMHLRLLEETELGSDAELRVDDDEHLLSVERTLEQLLDEDFSSATDRSNEELLLHVAAGESATPSSKRSPKQTKRMTLPSRDCCAATDIGAASRPPSRSVSRSCGKRAE